MSSSNFKATKIAIEHIFFDYWLSTPVQYAGMDFTKTDETPKWINVVYEPSSNEQLGIGGDTTVSYGSVYVVCWAEYQADVYGLSDDVVDFMNTYLPDDISNIEHSILDNGYNPNGDAFLVLHFSIKSYIRNC